MKNFSLVFLFLAAMLSFSCRKNEVSVSDPKTGSNSSVPSTDNSNANAQIPKTEKVNSDYVESESGTEKSAPAPGMANVQGKVLFNEKPAPNIEVRICEKFSRFIGGCEGESFKTKTDESGEYVFSNIKPGVYEGLLIRVFETKNYIFATQKFGISSAKYKFDPDKTFFAPETNLYKDDLKIQSPKTNEKLSAKDLEIKWDAYPDAAYYQLTLTPETADSDSSISRERVEGNSYRVQKSLKDGKYTLRLEAYNANKKKLAETASVTAFNLTN